MSDESKECRCDIKSALYSDMFGVVRCQYCGGIEMERTREFIKHNTPLESAIKRLKEE